MLSTELENLAAQLGRMLSARGIMLATAESCTGGYIGQTVTAVSGSSAWFDRGFITYSNDAKKDLLGVQQSTLARHGAVSAETVREMASGVLKHSKAGLALAVSGIAGPSGGSAEKPVGTVFIGCALRNGVELQHRFLFDGDRQAIRYASVEQALRGACDLLDKAGAYPIA